MVTGAVWWVVVSSLASFLYSRTRRSVRKLLFWISVHKYEVSVHFYEVLLNISVSQSNAVRSWLQCLTCSTLCCWWLLLCLGSSSWHTFLTRSLLDFWQVSAWCLIKYVIVKWLLTITICCIVHHVCHVFPRGDARSVPQPQCACMSPPGVLSVL